MGGSMKRGTEFSAGMYQRALGVTPGGMSHMVRHQAPYPLYIARAQGAWLWDIDGNEYIDLWMGHYGSILGHSPSAVTSRLKEFIDNGMHVGLGMEYEVELAELLSRLLPNVEKVVFCTSGTDANMYAVRIARGYTKRNILIKMVGGWHGACTDLMVDVKPPYEGLEGAGLPSYLSEYTRSAMFNDIEDTARVVAEVKDDLAGIIVEPVMGSAGFMPIEANYLEYLLEVTKQTGALLIADEVITGFRLGLTGAQGYYGFKADLTTYGKILGGGMAIGAVAGRDAVIGGVVGNTDLPKSERVLIGGGTHSCNPMTMIAALTTLDILQSQGLKIYPQLSSYNQQLCEGIKTAFDVVNIPVFISQVGSMQQVHFLHKEGLTVRHPRDVLENTYPKLVLRLAAILRGLGVFTLRSGALSVAHDEQIIERLVSAYFRAAEQLSKEYKDLIAE